VPVVLTAHESGRTVSVKSRTAIVVTLPSNPSTGFSWKLLSKDGAVVGLVSHRYVPPKVARPGAGGREVWTFAARTRGAAAIVLGYLRPWQPKHVVQRFRALIRVT
jgi:inhibitor of cysteine peptidase